MPEISFSKIKTYRRCPQAYHYRYNEGLRRKRPAKPLITGRILHEMIEARIGKQDPLAILAEYEKKYRVLFREEQEMFGETFIPDLKRIFEGYEKHYANEELKYESSEEFIATNLTKEIRFIGYIDNRAVDKNNRRWLVERKTHRSIPDEDRRFSDLQTVLYLWAFNREKSAMKIDGVAWDYLRTKAPAIPEELKKGGITQRKDIDTDYDTYMGRIKALNLDPSEYAEILKRLKDQENPFFRRVFLPSPPRVLVDQVVEDMRKTAIVINRLSKSAVYRNMTQDCSSMCEFYAVCQADLRGLDGKYVRKADYEVKTNPEEDNHHVGQESE